MSYKRIVFPTLILFIGMLLTACGGTGPISGESTQGSAATPAVAGTEETGGEDSAPGADLTLDPANLSGENAGNAAAYLYEGLTREQDGAVVGALAESFVVSEDGLDYIFTLRPGVAFHDGSELDADVVIANLNRWFDPADPNRGGGEYAAWAENFGGFKGEAKEDGKPKSWVDGFEKVDKYNFVIHLNAPDADLPKKLTAPAFYIVSPAKFSGGDGGTGPYVAASNDGTTLTLEPFAGYWDPASIPGENMEVPAP